MDENEDLLEIPEFLRREPKAIEKIPDDPIEIERQFVSVEEEGGNLVSSADVDAGEASSEIVKE